MHFQLRFLGKGSSRDIGLYEQHCEAGFTGDLSETEFTFREANDANGFGLKGLGEFRSPGLSFSGSPKQQPFQLRRRMIAN